MDGVTVNLGTDVNVGEAECVADVINRDERK